jgi:SAM-dependent methyltransferase
MQGNAVPFAPPPSATDARALRHHRAMLSTLPWNNPVAPDSLDQAIGLLSLGPDDALLDVGCGTGEVLARALAAWPCRGVGVDPDRAAIDAATGRLADDAPRVELRACSLSEANLAPGSFSAALCLGASHAFGAGGEALPAALRGLSSLVRPGGLIVLGTGYWKQTPDPAYLAATGLSADELGSLATTLDRIGAQGLDLLSCVRSSETAWDRFESDFWARAERAAFDAPQDEERQARWRRIQTWRDAYLRWGRTTMGFALFVLRTPRA